jgi:nicotinate-nucleotide pyrophosphorylase (carboxylating)
MIDAIVLADIVERALAEDLGFGDLTSQLVIPEDARAQLELNAREDLVLAGAEVAAAVFLRCDPQCRVSLRARDGDRLQAGASLGRVEGRARALLSAERTALNFLQHLSGIATLTAQYVSRIAGTRAVLLDTRKTTPGVRALEKHAVRMGGARNHRMRLDDGVLIKDNHISTCGSIAAAVERARAAAPLLTRIEVECDTLEQVGEALAAKADVILLDNMGLQDLRRAVALAAGRVPLEASGGVRLDNIRDIAETGVDFISVGRITQSAPAVDIGADALVHG